MLKGERRMRAAQQQSQRRWTAWLIYAQGQVWQRRLGGCGWRPESNDIETRKTSGRTIAVMISIVERGADDGQKAAAEAALAAMDVSRGGKQWPEALNV